MFKIEIIMKKLLLTAISAFGLLTISMAQLPSYVPTSGLIGWWPFTGNANDNSVNLNNGTVYGATLTTDRYGNPSCAYSFNGLTNSITATPSTLPLGSAPRSVHAWFNTTSGAIPTSQYPNLQAITGYGNPTSGAVIFDQMVVAPTGRSYFESGSSLNQIYSASPVNDGFWHNVVTTYGGPGTRVKMYIDGVINDSTAVLTLGTSSSVFGIGNTSYANIPFQGKIDDLGMWNRALTATEVCQLYNNPSFNITASSSTICAGKSTTLSVSGASTYTWSNASNATSIVITPTISVSYTVNGTTTAGCNIVATKSLIVIPNPTVSVTSGTICSGSAFTISPSGASTYSYSSGSAIVSPTSSATYSVTGTAINGCTNMAISSVTVNATPTISVTSGAICAGNPFTMVASGAGTYTYSGGSVVVTPTTNTSYSVTGTSTLGCVGSNTAISSVTVNVNPIVTVNSGVICSGNSFTMAASGASTYSYSSGSAIITPSISSSYSVTGASVEGCTNTAVSSVTVNATPTISVTSGAICAGKSFTMVATGAGTYTYSSGSAIVTPTASTSYSVVGTNSLGCVSSNTAVSSVTVNINPTVAASSSNSLICLGENALLSASTSATSYTWNTGATTMSVSVSPTITSTYTVSVSNAAACVASSTVMVTVNACTGINELLENSIYVYPNPTNGFLNISLIAELSQNSSLEIYDALGKLVFKQVLVNELNTINIYNLVDGIYTFKVLNNSNLIKTGKLIKQ